MSKMRKWKIFYEDGNYYIGQFLNGHLNGKGKT